MHCCIFQECTKSLWWSNVVTHPPSWLRGSPFKRGQLFVSHVNSSPHFVRKCPSTHNNFSPYKRGLGKRAAAWVYIEACAYPHGYTQLHRNLASTELNNRQKTADIFHHHHWFPCEMTSERNDCRNFILMRCHYPDLGSVSDWSFAEGKLQSEALLRSG